MDIFEAMRARHSVRKYLDRPIPAEVLEKLQAEVDACNREGRLHIQLVAEELVTFLQELGGAGKVVVQVSYEEKTGRKEFVLRDTVPGGNHLEDARLDELSATIVRNCADGIQYTTENGYNVLSLDIQE